MDSKDKQIEELKALVAELTERIAELELELAKAKKDSSTSSKPPSSDITKPKPKKKPGRRKKPRRGGQPGHQRQLREPLPPDRVDETIEYEIDDGEVERLGLTPTSDYEIVQHIELPETPVHVTEYRLAVYQDAEGQLSIPDSPEVKGPIFGPRLLATIGWLKSMGHCSYSTIEAWMEDILQVPVRADQAGTTQPARHKKPQPPDHPLLWLGDALQGPMHAESGVGRPRGCRSEDGPARPRALESSSIGVPAA